MLTKIEDLAYEVEGDSVTLEQDGGLGEVDRIILHRLHVAQLATEMGLLRGGPDAWAQVATLQRRLRLLCERIATLDDLLWSVPSFPPQRAPSSDCVYSQATRELAEEFVADLPAMGEAEEVQK